MKFRALKAFTFLLLLSFLFSHVSGAIIVDDLAKKAESFIKSKTPSSLTRKVEDKVLLQKFEKFKERTEKAQDIADSMFDVKDYLEKYGYLNSSTPPSNSKDESSMIKFQKYFNLKNSGKLDQNTFNILTKPRCGVPDIVATSFKQWWTGKELNYAFYPKNNVSNYIKSFFQDAFNRWSNVTALNFTETTMFDHSDIRIAFSNLDGKGEMVGGAYISNTNHFGIMFFDVKEQWVVSSKSAIGENDVDFESIVMHEIGHLLGLEHSSVEESIMYPIVLPQKKIELVNDDDLQKIQQIYGVKSVKSDVKNNNATSDSSWPVVFWPLSFLGFVCFSGLL